MRKKNRLIALSLFLAVSLPVWSAGPLAPPGASFSTLITTPLVVEGLTGDNQGNLYTPGRGGTPFCPIWRVNIANPSLDVVGNIPAPCSPSGIAFDKRGDLYVADGDTVYRFTPSAAFPPVANAFASGMPNTNGLAFDRDGNLWTGDGTAGNGIVWMITPNGIVQEMFRVQPMVNGLGVGRSANTQPENRPQPLVANGLAFTRTGDLLIADTARGALWSVQFDRHGNIKSNIGCDTTFAPNTLCLENIFVAHPFLEGADGFVLDRAGNMWVSANERNAVLVVTHQGEVSEVFRSPADSETGLRNEGPLESPTSPYIDARILCTANSDGGRRDNNPSSGGEVGGDGQDKGKISCLDQRLSISGLPLPIR